MAFINTCNPMTFQYNVGIGTDTNLAQTLTLCSTNTRIESRGGGNTSAGAYYTVYNGASIVGQSSQFVDNAGNWILYTGTTSESERLRVTATGNVSIGASSPFPAPKVDIRSSCPLTSEVGQPIFVGSNDVTGPLGVTIQHTCGYGVCRVDITSTRYGISGNDLSLNIDTSDPDTSGGLYIKYRGNVGIGTSSPDTRLHIRNCVNGSTNNFLLTLQNTCTVADARAGIAFLDNSNTAGSGGISGASIQVANDGIDGTGHLLFSSLLSGAVTERMRITSAGNVGIGTSSPTTGKLEVAGSILTSGGLVAALANSAALSFESTFSRLIAFGTDASTNGCFRLISSRSDGSNQLTWLAGNASGNVGINCLTPTYKLHVNGTFYAAGSSQDYKQSICNYNTDSCMFMKLKPVTYQYKEEYCHLGKELKSGTQIGLIAEDVAESHPELAILVNEEDNKVVRNVDYEKLSIILLSELQKLRKEVDELKQ